MNAKLQNLKARFEITQEQKEQTIKVAKTIALQIALGVVVSVTVKQVAGVIDNRIEEWKESRNIGEDAIEES